MFYVFDQKNHLSRLNAELKNFGLNPNDWKILKAKTSTYRVESKQDQNFAFIGKTSKKGKDVKWTQLELISL